MFRGNSYSAALDSFAPIKQLYRPLFTLSGALQVWKTMRAQHLESHRVWVHAEVSWGRLYKNVVNSNYS